MPTYKVVWKQGSLPSNDSAACPHLSLCGFPFWVYPIFRPQPKILSNWLFNWWSHSISVHDQHVIPMISPSGHDTSIHVTTKKWWQWANPIRFICTSQPPNPPSPFPDQHIRLLRQMPQHHLHCTIRAATWDKSRTKGDCGCLQNPAPVDGHLFRV